MRVPTLETPRLVLRAPAPEDLDAWTALMADREAAEFIGGLQPRANVWRAIRMMVGCWALDGFGYFSVVEKATRRWIGRVGPWHPEGWPGPEVGWGIIREAWGQGFAYEASVAAMDWVVDDLGWPDIVHVIHPENPRSQALARRLGSARRGPCRLPPPWEKEEMELWGQTAAAWRARGR
jgi:RimJ/RimL family protein N-acetyltransferase